MPQQDNANQPGGQHRVTKIALLCFSTLSAFSPLSAYCAQGSRDISAADISALSPEIHDMRRRQQAVNERINEIATLLNRLWGEPSIAKASKAAPEPVAVPVAVSAAGPKIRKSGSGNEPGLRLDASGGSRLHYEYIHVNRPPGKSLKPEVTESKAIEHTDSQSHTRAATSDRWTVTGDFRLRYENNSSYGTTSASDRGVLRGRLATRYAFSDALTLGARMVTGDSDNPRTADLTIGDSARDLEVSLDHAYVEFRHEDLFLTGGKFAKLFRSTELVWDGDVNPQGLGGHYDLYDGSRVSTRFSGIYFVIDEADGRSDLRGGQLSLNFHAAPAWEASLDVAYFDYELGSLSVPGSAADRGNNLAQNGRNLLSDFNLLDVVGTLDYSGFGDRWHVKLVADTVKNTGARVPEDSAWGFDVFLGGLNETGDFLFRYGYSQAETDAVLGMFSHDNIAIATNYELHTASIDYRLAEHTYLGVTQYVFQTLDPLLGRDPFVDDWAYRTRLNLYFQF